MYYTITSDDATVIIKVNDKVAGKALPGQTIKALANKDGWEFEKWEATGVDLGNQVNKNWITFKMPESNVTLNPQYAKLHAIQVVNGRQISPRQKRVRKLPLLRTIARAMSLPAGRFSMAAMRSWKTKRTRLRLLP